MRLEDFDFDLPPEQIAQEPLPERDASRLLVVDRQAGSWWDRSFRDFSQLLRGDELVVLNNARVFPVRLFAHRLGLRAQKTHSEKAANQEFLSSPIEVLLVRQIEPGFWEALVRPGRKVSIGETLIFGDGDLSACVEGRGKYGLRQLRFNVTDDFWKVVQPIGHIPLPPYIRRPDAPADHERYQTVFASSGVAAAAPTAGLHFTSPMLSALCARGVEIRELTLEIGLGTFEPIRTDEVEQHSIHTEWYEIPESTAFAIDQARRANRPILAVGTTVVRALEDAARKQSEEPGRKSNDPKAPVLMPGRAEASIYLYPGRPFRIVNAMLTNFHLPRSSLLVMVAAFAGRERILAAYRHAVSAGYRFYSYGDCMLIR